MYAIEEILTVHRLKVPALFRKTLHSTNPLESMFSIVWDAEDNINRNWNSRMLQRWLVSVLLKIQTNQWICFDHRGSKNYRNADNKKNNWQEGCLNNDMNTRSVSDSFNEKTWHSVIIQKLTLWGIMEELQEYIE